MDGRPDPTGAHCLTRSQLTVQSEPDALRVEAHCTVAVEPEAAFSAFTAGLHAWWPRAYSWGPDGLDRHELEPRHHRLPPRRRLHPAYAESMRSAQGWPHLLEQFAAPLEQ